MPAERKGAAYSIKHRKPGATQESQPPHHTKTIPSAIRRPPPLSAVPRPWEHAELKDVPRSWEGPLYD
jgi:hypothetical protein